MEENADFYIKEGQVVRYIGSVSYGGKSIRDKITLSEPNYDQEETMEFQIQNAKDKKTYLEWVGEYLMFRGDYGSFLDTCGWPWVYDSPKETHFIFLFDCDGEGMLAGCGFEGQFEDIDTPTYFVPIFTKFYNEETGEFPDIDKIEIILPNMSKTRKFEIPEK